MKSKKITMVLMMYYLLVLIWIIVFKLQFSINELPQIRNINLIPFDQSVTVNGSLYMGEIILNVLAFIPFGLFINILMDEKSIIKQCLIIFFISFLFELIQFIFAIGASDITDIISNSLGGVIGVIISIIMFKFLGERLVKYINIISIFCAIILTAIILILLLSNI